MEKRSEMSEKKGHEYRFSTGNSERLTDQKAVSGVNADKNSLHIELHSHVTQQSTTLNNSQIGKGFDLTAKVANDVIDCDALPGNVRNSSNDKRVRTLQVGYNASGAVAAAAKGDVVVIVDVIDMSTTAEAVLDAGALTIYGAAPDRAKPPVPVDPEKMGYLAGRRAVEAGSKVILVAEPRYGTEEERIANSQLTLTGISRSGAILDHIIPNIGGEVSRLADFTDRVVIIVSDTGGVAFDAAYSAGAPEILTGTVARTCAKRGLAPLEAAAKRAIEAAERHGTGITCIAASANSYEDCLAAEALARKIIENGFLR